MYQPETQNYTQNPIPVIDCSDCFVDIAIVDTNNKNENDQIIEPVSIKIIPQVVIPVHDCEIIYYEPTRNRQGGIDRSIHFYKMSRTITCSVLAVFATYYISSTILTY